ncbi:MAG: 50S ribosomal protein L20, partial [Elusimicrobia bacterium]|nr:50S ribosomal protein L20 [Elusimicrobiota bacterium]
KKNRWVQAVKAAARAMKYSTRDRKARARNFRSLWIIRITAACEQNGISYSRFIKGLKEAKIGLNRKMLSEIALDAPAVFSQIVAAAEKALPAKVTRKKVAAS